MEGRLERSHFSCGDAGALRDRQWRHVTTKAQCLPNASNITLPDNFSAAVTPLVRLTLSVDYYPIELRDRIVLSSDFRIGPKEVAALEALGVRGACSFAQVGFFNNDLDTQTQGVDVVATYTIASSAELAGFSASLKYPREAVATATLFHS